MRQRGQEQIGREGLEVQNLDMACQGTGTTSCQAQTIVWENKTGTKGLP